MSLWERTLPHRSASSLEVSSRWLALASRARDTASDGTSLRMGPKFRSASSSCKRKKNKNICSDFQRKIQRICTGIQFGALTATSFVSPCSKYSCTIGVTVFSKSLSSSGGTTVSYTQFSCQNKIGIHVCFFLLGRASHLDQKYIIKTYKRKK